ncbi:hypothetical protein [Vibrio sp. TBV020]|uniref:hypothetical protein n=1 Tax=Vibrio sp. TBV020 TaxID=3137398 RepID=UPI0038CDB26D
MSNDYYERKAELEPFTTARSDDVRNELDAVQSAFEKLPKPRQDGTIGFLTSFTIVAPTEDNHPATHGQVAAEGNKNNEQDDRLDNIENSLTGLGPVDGRFTTLRYVATEGQTQIVLPSQFQSLAYVHKNGGRLYQTVGFNYDVPTKTITFTSALTLNDEVLVDVGMVPDAVLADLIAIQEDIAERQTDVTQKQQDVTTKHQEVTSMHSDVDSWQQQVSQDKDTTVQAKDETKATYALLQKLHLGSHATPPTTDNDGNPLTEGASYYNSTDGKSYVYEQGAWVVTNLSALTTVSKDSPTGKAFMPVGTSAEGGTPDKGAFRYDDDEDEFQGGNGVEWAGVGGGGVPKFILKTANFSVAKKKAYELDMSDDISKTALVPIGMPNGTWFAVSAIGSTGADSVYITIDTQTETWDYDDGTHTGYKFPANSNATYYFRKNNRGKWVVADGVGETSRMPDVMQPNPNVFINALETENQREVIDWASVTIGEYGFDRWKKIDANTKRQPVEDLALLPSTTYTLSYVDGGDTIVKQVISPASGHWDSTDLDVPITASMMKLELGSVATPFVPDDPATNLAKCQRYYIRMDANDYADALYVGLSALNNAGHWTQICFPVTMRTQPDVSSDVSLTPTGTSHTPWGARYSTSNPSTTTWLIANAEL